MKTKQITIVSRYHKHSLRLRIPESSFDRLMGLDNPMVGVYDDLYRYCCSNFSMCFFSRGQVRKILDYFGIDDCNFFDTVLSSAYSIIV